MDELCLSRCRIEKQDKWHESIDTIPFIKFPTDWQVQVIPPFGGAMARFRVKLPSGVEKSVYLDFYDRLGYMRQPYWEVYPAKGDCGRALLNETDLLLELIGDESEDSDQNSGEHQ